MARVAETIVEEWLNRQGYFTVRGLKRGHNEIDLLAFRCADGDAVHVEVMSNVDPAGYIGDLPYARLEEGITEFVRKKYHNENADGLRKELCSGREWRFMFAHGKLKKEEEQRSLLRAQNVEVKRISEILDDLADKDKLSFKTDSDAAHFAALR